MKRLSLVLVLPLSLTLSALSGCEKKAEDTAPAVIDPESCAITGGKTALDSDGRVMLPNPSELVHGGIAIHGCDLETAPNGSRWWLVSGAFAGTADNGQEGLIVDSHGDVLSIHDLRGFTSTSPRRLPGTHFTASCKDISGDGDGCKVVKADAEEKDDKIVIKVPKGTEVKIEKD